MRMPSLSMYEEIAPVRLNSASGNSTLLETRVTDSFARRLAFANAAESSWREDIRCVSNGDQVSRVTALAMKRGKSADFTGYWQRAAWRRGPPMPTASRRRATEGYGLKEAMKESTFWRLNGALLLAVCAINGTLTHLVPMLMDRGLSGSGPGGRHRSGARYKQHAV